MTISSSTSASIVSVDAGNNNSNTLNTPPCVPAQKFVFTTSFAKAPTPGIAPRSVPQHDAEWMQQQRAAVAAHRAAQHARFVANHDDAHARAWRNESDRRAAATMLLREAAARDLAFIEASVAASGVCAAAQVTSFCRGTWSALHAQAAGFFGAIPVTAEQPHAGSQAALEIISSLALWHHGDGVSLPLRRYVVLLPPPGPAAAAAGSDDDAAPALVPTPVLGLTSFAYSTYVLQLRQDAQLRVLAALAGPTKHAD